MIQRITREIGAAKQETNNDNTTKDEKTATINAQSGREV